jgi:hypothetical protein
MSNKRETSKQRLFTALRGGRPAALPAAPAYLVLFLADLERQWYVEQYRLRLRGCTRYSINHAEDTRLRAEAIYHSYGIFKTRPDWMEVHRGSSRAWSERTEIVARDGFPYYHDLECGVLTPMHSSPLPRGDRGQASPSSTSDIWDSSSALRDRLDIDERLPLVTAQELLARGDLDLPRQVVADCGDETFISTVLDTPFADAYDLLGFQGLMLMQHDRPALLHHLLQRQLVASQEVMVAWAATGIHGVWVEEVFTGADMISARSYDEFVFNYNQPYFRKMSELGLLPIHYVCGDAIPRVERIVQLDIAAVAVEESKKNFRLEIEELVRRVDGRVAVLGNIDAVRFGLGASLDEMAAEVRRQAHIGSRARGFVVSTGSPFPLDANPRLIDTMVATAHGLVA